MLWSRLVEPGDRAACRFVHGLGAEAAARAVVAGDDSRVEQRWRARLAVSDVRQDLRRLERVNGRVVIPGDDEWPVLLDDLGDRAPFCLWVRGPAELGRDGRRTVAVVGARAASTYGDYVASELGFGLADRGITVVSGAAHGIDAAAHRGALASGRTSAIASGGTTIAVLAGGVDRSYPRGNYRLIEQIAGCGNVVSESPPGCAPTRWRFVQRNRLIAALTGATVVVEAALRSGTSITAREAADLGRQVGAVPGPVTSPASAGCHELLRNGAVCVTRAEEAVELVSGIGEGLERRMPTPDAEHDGLPPDDLRVLDAVPLRRPARTETVARTAGLDPARTASALTLLEMRGLVRGGVAGWVRSRPAPARRA